MGQYENRSRRQVLRLAGGVGTVLLAGCLADGSVSERSDDHTGDDSDDRNESGSDTSHEETDDASGDRPASVSNTDEDDGWTAVDEVRLSADTTGWEGLEPPVIAGEMNPTLVLTEGREYTITWENADGVPHNIELWDDEEAIVGEYETELMEEEGETQSLSFEATPEMVEYTCSIHADWSKRGSIAVRSTDE